MKKTILCLLMLTILLSGCGVLENMPKPPQTTEIPAETAAPSAEPSSAPTEEPSAEASAAPEETPAEPAETAAPKETGQPAEEAGRGMLLHIERSYKEAMDPATGSVKILDFAWDSVRAVSEENPEAATRITEQMAARQDAWYTGSGSEEDGNIYGYDTMLGLAEDNFTLAQEYEGLEAELSSALYVSALRSDAEICVLQEMNYTFLGGVHGSYAMKAVCFDARTGNLLTLDDLGPDPEALRTRLVSEMVRLAEEDADGYYTAHISMVVPAEYQKAFAALLRQGAWYPGLDGFHIGSDLYELGSYASGLTDFCIPYESLTDVLDARWIPAPVSGTASVRLETLTEVPEGSIEIVDRVMVGDGGETFLLCFDGSVRDVALERTSLADLPLADGQIFYCGSLRDAAIQMAITFAGDLPDFLLRYTDDAGEHTWLLMLSGEDGSVRLIQA